MQVFNFQLYTGTTAKLSQLDFSETHLDIFSNKFLEICKLRFGHFYATFTFVPSAQKQHFAQETVYREPMSHLKICEIGSYLMFP